ncbi:hypothetical protein, conserved [Babesia ovata]|uniref:Uncharacterized protein n=1 Tax=Babesia ovata TaxID=189622 RepID=A0A2H6K8E8_9APIC|nr:uncharacterized protein BOVATA_007750 [Babesia ovata]GBE59282.1 hypothetical protein, conserved [Babesia ovata]
MITLGGFAVVVPEGSDDSDIEVIPPNGLHYYAIDEYHYGRIKRLANLFKDFDAMHSDLLVVSSAIGASEAPLETKTAAQEACELIEKGLIDLTSDAKEYTELGNIFDKYREMLDEFNHGGATQEMSAELRAAVSALEQQFDGKQALVIGATSHRLLDIEARISRAADFIEEHRAVVETHHETNKPVEQEEIPPFQDPLAPQSPDQGTHETEEIDGDVVNGDENTAQPAEASEYVQIDDEEPEDSTEEHTSDLQERTPPADESMERIRAYLRDRSILPKLSKLHKYAQSIDEVMHGLTVDEADSIMVPKKTLSGVPQCTGASGTLCDIVFGQSAKIDMAYVIYKRYGEIIDTLEKTDPNSPQVKQLMDEQQQLEREFERFEPLVTMEILDIAERDELATIHLLEVLKVMVDGESSPESVADEISTSPAEKSSGAEDAPTTEGDAAGNGDIAKKMRGTKDTAASSGIVAMGIRAIQATVALYMIATL